MMLIRCTSVSDLEQAGPAVPSTIFSLAWLALVLGILQPKSERHKGVPFAGLGETEEQYMEPNLLLDIVYGFVQMQANVFPTIMKIICLLAIWLLYMIFFFFFYFSQDKRKIF